MTGSPDERTSGGLTTKCTSHFRLYDPSRRRVRAGSTYRNTGGQVVGVLREYNHPAYQVASRYDSDIAVIRLNGLLILGPRVQQGPIAASGTIVPDNVPVIHAGWGHTIVRHFSSLSFKLFIIWFDRESGGKYVDCLNCMSILVLTRIVIYVKSLASIRRE